MGDIINIVDRLRDSLPADDLSVEQFLLDEGLDLLAAYRKIENATVRKSLLLLIQCMGQEATRRADLSV